jgi:hypothetical protein
VTAPISPHSHPAPTILPRPTYLDALALPSPHCTADGCRRTDTVTADGVNGRRCADHPARLRIDYVRHLLEHGWPGTALAYLRVPGVAS